MMDYKGRGRGVVLVSQLTFILVAGPNGLRAPSYIHYNIIQERDRSHSIYSVEMATKHMWLTKHANEYIQCSVVNSLLNDDWITLIRTHYLRGIHPILFMMRCSRSATFLETQHHAL